MLNAWDLERWGCRIFRLLEIGGGGGGEGIRGREWLGGGGGGDTILGIWNVWDVECLAYEMFWI